MIFPLYDEDETVDVVEVVEEVVDVTVVVSVDDVAAGCEPFPTSAIDGTPSPHHFQRSALRYGAAASEPVHVKILS